MSRSSETCVDSSVDRAVLDDVPVGCFVLTASHDDCRAGSLVKWVQRCSDAPPMVMVAHRKGHPIEPLIRDSRAFGLCQLEDEDVLLRRKFESNHPHGEDPFVSLPTRVGPCGSPILLRSRAFMACELTRHLDIESDYEIYIGIVRHAQLLRGEDATAGRVTASAPLRRPA